MAQSPIFKVYRGSEYVAACKYLEDAAILASNQPEGNVRAGHKARDIIWQEGHEDISAGESFDEAAAIMRQRFQAIIDKENSFIEKIRNA